MKISTVVGRIGQLVVVAVAVAAFGQAYPPGAPPGVAYSPMGDSKVDGYFWATNYSYFGNVVEVGGGVKTSGTLDVQQLTSLNGGLSVAAGATLTANGPVVANDSLTVGLLGKFNGGLDVAAGTTLTANGPLVAKDSLTVGTKGTFNGGLDVAAGTTLTAYGPLVAKGTLDVASPSTFRGGLDVAAGTTLTAYGPLVAKGTLDVASSGTFRGGLDVGGQLNLGGVVVQGKNGIFVVNGAPVRTSADMAEPEVPLNGSFERATGDLNTTPPDYWTLGAGETWGPSGSVFYGVDAERGRFITLRAGSSLGKIVSSPIALRPGATAINIHVSVRVPVSSPSFLLHIHADVYSDAELTNLVASREFFHAGGNGVWRHSASSVFGAGVSPPPHGAYMVIVLSRLGIYGDSVDIGDVFVRDGSVEQEFWNQLALNGSGGWTNYGGAFETASYFKDSMGVVHLRGMVQRRGGGGDTSLMFTMPDGYRPSNAQIFTGMTSGGVAGDDMAGRIDMNYDGATRLIKGLSAGYVSLAGITFDTR